MNFNYSPSTSLPYGKTGELVGSWLDSNGVLNYDINVNANLWPTASQELALQTYLHEALHGALLTNGVAWNNVLQHDEIADTYRGEIASNLIAAFPSLSSSDAYDLSWGGLQSTSAYTHLPSWKRTEIENKLGAHMRGEEGTNC